MHLYGCKNYDFKFTMSYGATVCLEPKQRRWCSGIMQDSHSCDPGSIPGRRNQNFYIKHTAHNVRLHVGVVFEA